MLRLHGAGTIAEIAQNTGLTFPAVSKLMKELMEAGIVKVKGEGESSGGRKPLLYELDAEALYVLAADISVEQIRVALMNFDMTWVSDRVVEAPGSGKAEDYVKTLAAEARNLIQESKVAEERILGMGVSVPGPVDASEGVVHDPPNLPHWKVVPLKQTLEQELHMLVKVEKDANCAALGEKWFGAGQDAEQLVYVFVGEGIGGGVILEGSLYRGHSFGAGEIGHGTVDLDGPRCNCGNYGCLEALASGLAVVRRVQEELRRGSESPFYPSPEDVTFARVLQAIHQRDKLTERLFEEASRLLGIGLGGVVHTLYPQKVILGGKLPQAYPPMIAIAEKAMKRRMLSIFQKNIEVVPAHLGEKSSLTGAAVLIFEDLFRLQWD